MVDAAGANAPLDAALTGTAAVACFPCFVTVVALYTLMSAAEGVPTDSTREPQSTDLRRRQLSDVLAVA